MALHRVHPDNAFFVRIWDAAQMMFGHHGTGPGNKYGGKNRKTNGKSKKMWRIPNRYPPRNLVHARIGNAESHAYAKKVIFLIKVT